MRSKIPFLILIAIVLSGLIIQCSSPINTDYDLQGFQLRVGTVPAIVEGLNHTAYEEGLYDELGLDVSMTVNPDGRSNLLQVLSGELDIGGTMATPTIYQAINGEEFKIIAKVQYQFPIHDGVGRIDRGITKDPQSLVGKTVATLLGTSAHYHFDSWLLYNGLDIAQLNIVDIPAPEGLEALENGEVDAMFYWFPFNAMASQSLGDNAVNFFGEDLVPSSWVYVARTDFIEENPEVIEAFLFALLEAKQVYDNELDASASAHSIYSGVEESILLPAFQQMKYDLVLDQALLSDMEYQTEWFQQEGYFEIDEVPYYPDFIYPDALMKLAPANITILFDN